MAMADLRVALFSVQVAASANVRNDIHICTWNNINIFTVLRIIVTNTDYFPPNSTFKSTMHKFASKCDFMH